MKRTLLITTFMIVAIPAAAQLRLDAVYGDHMVLQRGVELPIEGYAGPDAEVSVRLGDLDRTTRTSSSGTWRVSFPAMTAGGPYELQVASGDQQITFSDVLIGDVWLASGQSNMEWVVADAKTGAEVVASANDPQLRHFKVPRSYSTEPVDTLAGGEWEVTAPGTVGGFTAVGYFFARNLREHVGVPIGILHSSWGGSRLEPWMSAKALGVPGAEIDAILRRERERDQATLDNLRKRIGNFSDQDVGMDGGTALWAAPDLDDSDWMRIAVPALWEQQGFDGMDGIGWYRTTFELSADEAKQGATLGVGTIDDSDRTWVNGKEVGSTEMAYNRARVYTVPASVLKEGRNVLVVRVEDTGGGGGIYGDPNLLYIETAGGKRSLVGDWRFHVGAVSISLDAGKNQIPTLLYNYMIKPLQKYPIAGAIWYQGESNAGSVEDAENYSPLFRGLIESWRDEWGVGDFPFFWVQLANYMEPDAEPAKESGWASLRESQSDALELDATGQAVIIDIGETNDIHPKNKKDVGERLALAARHVAYGEDIVYSGPVYHSHEVKPSGEVVIRFDHVGGGLVVGSKYRSGDDGLKGFAVADADGRWSWADARLEGDTVIVWSADVKHPVAVRYAWGNNPIEANLYNKAGLPANPFQTGR